MSVAQRFCLKQKGKNKNEILKPCEDQRVVEGSLRSMAVLSSRAQVARLYYLARPTKTAMLRRLGRRSKLDEIGIDQI